MSSSTPDRKIFPKIRRSSFLRFVLLIVLAYVMARIPILHLPFSWMETFFHEISHGLAAIVFFGSIEYIQLNLDGSGLCASRSPYRFPVVFMGYAGAIFWGVLIYLIASKIQAKFSFVIAFTILGLMVWTALFWASNVTTILILAVMALPFVFTYFVQKIWLEKILLQFIGVYVLLDALRSPLHLWNHDGHNDAKTLYNLTGFPEPVWIIIWVLMGVSSLYFLYKTSK